MLFEGIMLVCTVINTVLTISREIRERNRHKTMKEDGDSHPPYLRQYPFIYSRLISNCQQTHAGGVAQLFVSRVIKLT